MTARFELRSYLPRTLYAQQESLSHRRGFLADRLIAELPGLVSISHNSSARHHRRQHVAIFQPVDIAPFRVANVDLLAPAIIRMCANTVNGNDTGARLSASVDNFRREGYRNHTRPTVPYQRLSGHKEARRGP